MTLYIVVVEINKNLIGEYKGPVGELKKFLDTKIGYGLGNMGKIKSSEVVKGESQYAQLHNKRASLRENERRYR